jgi:hypothetical protein
MSRRKPAPVDTTKLFRVLVLGGLSMAIPACSSAGPTDDAGTANDSAAQNDAKPQTDAGSSNDAATIQDVAADAPCLNKPGDCTHGLCSW